MLISRACVRIFDGEGFNLPAVLQGRDGVRVLIGGRQIEVGAAHMGDGEGFESVHGFMEHGPQFFCRAQSLDLYP